MINSAKKEEKWTSVSIPIPIQCILLEMYKVGNNKVDQSSITVLVDVTPVFVLRFILTFS